MLRVIDPFQHERATVFSDRHPTCFRIHLVLKGEAAGYRDAETGSACRMGDKMSLGLLRFLAIGLSLSLMVGESIRSWGVGRPIMFVLDDFFAGGLLLLGAILMANPSWLRSNIFIAGWGACAGMLYGSFFGKVFDPASGNPGNFDLGLLTWLIGLAFVVSLIGLWGSILLQLPQRPSDGPPPQTGEELG